jgi:hypothetical protein
VSRSFTTDVVSEGDRARQNLPHDIFYETEFMSSPECREILSAALQHAPVVEPTSARSTCSSRRAQAGC